MKIMLDTNILISSILFPNSQTAKAIKYCILDHKLYISLYVIEEFKKVMKVKFAYDEKDLDTFLDSLTYFLIINPKELEQNLFYVRDPKDYLVLYSTLIVDVDIMLSGDKDLKDTSLKKPVVLTPGEFLLKYYN